MPASLRDDPWTPLWESAPGERTAIEREPMTGINWIELAGNLIPALLLIAAFFYLSSQFRGKNGFTQMQYLEELLAETKRHNEQLEKLVAALIARGNSRP